MFIVNRKINIGKLTTAPPPLRQARGRRASQPEVSIILISDAAKSSRDLHDSVVQTRYSKEARIYRRIWNQDSSNAVFSFDHTQGGSETKIPV
jgi:hypothetical protein